MATTDNATFGANPDVVVSLTGAFGSDIGTGSVLDNEAAPVYAISDAVVTEGGTLQFTVSRTTPTAIDTVVTTDHGNVTILAGATSAVLEVATTDNATFGANPDVVVSLTGAFGSDVGTGSVLDNEAAPVYVIPYAVVTEGGTLQFTVSRTTPTAIDTVVTTDHGNVTILAGATSAVLEVATTDNATFGANPDVVVSLTGAFGSDIGTGSVLDNEAAPVYAISDAVVTEGGTLQFSVSRTTPTAIDTVVTTDHGNVTILAGATSAVLEVATTDNATFGANPDVVVSRPLAPSAATSVLVRCSITRQRRSMRSPMRWSPKAARCSSQYRARRRRRSIRWSPPIMATSRSWPVRDLGGVGGGDDGQCHVRGQSGTWWCRSPAPSAATSVLVRCWTTKVMLRRSRSSPQHTGLSPTL